MKKNSRRFAGSAVIISVLITCVYAFQNCSQSSQFAVSDAERAYYESTAEKTVEIEVKDRSNAPNNLKIAFFVDESASMVAVKDRVAQGLDSLAKRITGLRASVRFFGVSQIDYEIANVNKATLTADQYVNSKQVFRTTAANLGVVGASFSTNVVSSYRNLKPVTVNSEKGRISLARVLANDSDQSFFKPGDVGVAIVITDEDDPVADETSSINSSYKIPGKLVNNIQLTYNVTNLGFDYRVVAADGTVSSASVLGGSANVKRSRFQCPAGNIGAQDSGALAAIREAYSQQPNIANNIVAVTSCNSNATYKRDFSETIFTRPASGPFDCAMTNFKYSTGTNTFATVTDFANTSFISSGFELNTVQPCIVESPLKEDGSLSSPSPSFDRNLPAAKSLKTLMTEQTNISTVNEYVAKRASQIFGDNKFYFAALVNKDSRDPNCPLASEQKVGQGYMQLASLLNGKTHSICSPSYANVMDELSEFISKEIDGYHIPAGRRINSATLVKANGDKILLVINVDFRFDGEFFALISDKPVAGDKVIIKYQ